MTTYPLLPIGMIEPTHTVRSEDGATYRVNHDNEIIAKALAILQARTATGPAMLQPQDVRNYLTIRAAGLEREVFGVMYLNAQHHIIATEDAFVGTLMQTSVYPREIVKRALQLNAAAVILTHNHPSGATRPSAADESLTALLKKTLALVDVVVLDHVITAGGASASMAEMGLV